MVGGGWGGWHTKCIRGDVQMVDIQRLMYRAHVLKRPAAMQMYCNKRMVEKKSSTSTGLVWDANIEVACEQALCLGKG